MARIREEARGFGFGRIPVGDPRLCPSGDFGQQDDAESVIAAMVPQLLGDSNSRDPDPAGVWAIMDEALRRPFGSFKEFGRHMSNVELDPVYARWGVSEEVLREGRLDDGVQLVEIEESCGEKVSESTWMASASFPDFQGVSGGAVQLFFIIRADGPKLWFAY